MKDNGITFVLIGIRTARIKTTININKDIRKDKGNDVVNNVDGYNPERL